MTDVRGLGEWYGVWRGVCGVRCRALRPQAALQENRQRAFDDFIAVAEDLIARGVTRPAKLGILGESNGGLLVGVAVTQRPRLFAAVICRVCGRDGDNSDGVILVRGGL